MPWDSDRMFFRREQGTSFSSWKEVIHSGNISTFTQLGPDGVAALELKADTATTYTKTEVDNSLLLKANQSTTYTKTEVDNNLALNATQSTTYTIT